ncbi:glycoside hydrolase family 16 protein [Bacteroides congonensis]
MKHLLFPLWVFIIICMSCEQDVLDASNAISEPPTTSSSSTEPVEWELVFEDDFDDPTRQGKTSYECVDTTGTKNKSGSGWGLYYTPGHKQNGLRRPWAFSVQDGILTITARMEDGQIVSGGMRHWTEYCYGKFEFKVRVDREPSGVMGAVVLTWPQSERWPLDGELDIFETGPGIDRNNFFTAIHYGEDNKQYIKTHNLNGREWRIMAMEWMPDYIRIFINGQQVYECTDKVAIPHVPHHLCIQLDASSSKPLIQPTKMFVDWVKIYQPKKTK